jgi:DNA-binding response OmpR family regulator
MKKTRVLIVDDHGEIRKLLRLSFDPDRHQIFEAGDGAAALALARRKPPRLVLLDVMMPGGLDGFEVCRQLKSDPQLAGVKVMLLTARSQAGDLLAGRLAGADAYLVKPFSPIELMDRAEALLAAGH